MAQSLDPEFPCSLYAKRPLHDMFLVNLPILIST